MTVTLKQLQHILPNAGTQAGVFLPVLNAAMVKWGIVTPLRKRAFLAQIGHESGQLRYVHELGNDQYLAKYDTGKLAARLGNTPQADGDGQKYRGRGRVQVTGYDNYKRCGEALGLDLRARPELLEHPEPAADSAGWFWNQAGLNHACTTGNHGYDKSKEKGRWNGRLYRLDPPQEKGCPSLPRVPDIRLQACGSRPARATQPLNTKGFPSCAVIRMIYLAGLCASRADSRKVPMQSGPKGYAAAVSLQTRQGGDDHG